MSTALLNSPDVKLFWTAYDPLDVSSDSIDPLGFLVGYVALADRILPGFTTITTVPRYPSMLCYALKGALETMGGRHLAAADRRKAILEKLQLIERSWALACGLAAEESDIGEPATDGLRGVRAVHRYLSMNGGRARLSRSFSLLSNQIRYGGIGAYSTFLESLHLADMYALKLRPLGEQLAAAFPCPNELGQSLFERDSSIPTNRLREWGRQAHAATLSNSEGKILKTALRGSDEAEFDDRTRWFMLNLLKECRTGDGQNEPELLGRCLAALKKPKAGEDLDLAKARIGTALQVIEWYEQLYQCAGFVFDVVRALAGERGHARLEVVGQEKSVQDATRAARRAAEKLIHEVAAASEGEEGLGPARGALHKEGMMDFAANVVAAKDPVALNQEILRRHARVQEGKYDAGQPKGPWAELESGGSSARVTQQRFRLAPSKLPESWAHAARHPYRTFGAMRFIRLCRI